MSHDPEIPIEYLTLFDRLDLEQQHESRAATRAIVDFYGHILYQVGTSYLGFEPGDLTQGVGPQWNKAKDRLRAIEDIEIPEEFNSLLNRLHQTQNSVDHQFHHDPDTDLLEEARKSAQRWAGWFWENAAEYESTVGEQSAQETMIRLTRQLLSSIQSPPEAYEYEDLISQQAEFNEEAENMMEQLENVEQSTDSISNELVFLLSDATSLEQSQESFDIQYHRRKQQERQDERRRAWEEYRNTKSCYVTEQYDETGQITIVTDEVGQEDQTMVIDPHHPETSQDTFEQLTEAEPNIRYHITFDYDEELTRYVRNLTQQ